MNTLKIINAHAAGIDVGSEAMHVSIAGGPAQIFGTMTADLYMLRNHLKEEGVTTVAMEATGVYWFCLYEILQVSGLEVVMVNGRHVKNLPGRKTDVADCQWLATLHAHGLLRGGFVPDTEVRRLQDYVRLRNDHISLAASHVQHMQKALDRMNIKVHEVISSLTGSSGMAMLRAIVGGERDPQKLLALCNVQIRKNKADRILAALQGTWNREHIFALTQALSCWDFYQTCIFECDAKIAEVLAEMPTKDDGANGDQEGGKPTEKAKAAPKERKGASANAPKIPNLHELITGLFGGRDASVLPGITDYSTLQLTSEVGRDLSRWPTAKHFTSWLGLAPQASQGTVRLPRAHN